MDKKVYDNYVKLLHDELTMATGCTEPIAIAYAGAKLREVLGDIPEHCTVYCSGNIVKNVMAVTVPNSGGARGIDTAALLGIIGGDASRVLDVLHSVSDEDIALMHKMVADHCCDCELVEGVANLYIRIEANKGDQTALVEIKDYHSNITRIEKNGEVIYDAAQAKQEGTAPAAADKSLLNVRDIYDFANEVNLDDVREVLENQIKCNSAIAEEGLKNPWGAEVGRTIAEESSSLVDRARAYAAAGSDARMNGCAMPVVINSGSGNQGMTASLPVIEYARELSSSEDELYRALLVSNLVTLHQKTGIGRLSAYCGAVSAGAGAGAGIAFLCGADYATVAHTVINAVAVTSGIVCDGAKASCAGKISVAVDAGIMGYEMCLTGNNFHAGDGILADSVENTIKNVGRLGRVGMRDTDREIMKIMTGN